MHPKFLYPHRINLQALMLPVDFFQERTDMFLQQYVRLNYAIYLLREAAHQFAAMPLRRKQRISSRSQQESRHEDGGDRGRRRRAQFRRGLFHRPL